MKIIFDLHGWNLIKDKIKLRTDVEIFEEQVMMPIDQSFLD